MPRYELRDASGQHFLLSTASDQLAQAWFDEWLPVLYPPGLADDYGLPLMQVYPLSPDGRSADWATDMRWVTIPFTIPRDPRLALAAIASRRIWIEQQARRADGQRQ